MFHSSDFPYHGHRNTLLSNKHHLLIKIDNSLWSAKKSSTSHRFDRVKRFAVWKELTISRELNYCKVQAFAIAFEDHRRDVVKMKIKLTCRHMRY